MVSETETVIPWWVKKGFESMADAIEDQLAKVKATTSPVVIPAGTPDQWGDVMPYDIRLDAAQLMGRKCEWCDGTGSDSATKECFLCKGTGIESPRPARK